MNQLEPTPSETAPVVHVAFGLRMAIYAPFSTAFKNALKQAVPWAERSWVKNHWEIDLKHRGVVTELIKAYYGV